MIMFTRRLLTVIASLACVSSLALADDHITVETDEEKQSITIDNTTVVWGDYRDYADVKAANQSRKKFAQRTFKELTKYFAKLSEKLPEGTTLNVEVTELDLAGQVLPASFVGIGSIADDIRVIKSLYIPRMNFSYTLTDATGNVIKSEDVELKDMSFSHRHNPLFSSDNLRHEKNMLRTWFNKNVLNDSENA